MPPAHVPTRTCVGCGERGEKRGLVRIVALAGDAVRVDRTGSAPGRGAYVHRCRSCVDRALSRGGLARALRIGLNEDGAATLRAELEGDWGR